MLVVLAHYRFSSPRQSLPHRTTRIPSRSLAILASSHCSSSRTSYGYEPRQKTPRLHTAAGVLQLGEFQPQELASIVSVLSLTFRRKHHLLVGCGMNWKEHRQWEAISCAPAR